jgi:uncharacterized protein YndB with AHSA1/START domain
MTDTQEIRTQEFGTFLDKHTLQFVRILPGPIEKVWSFLWESEKRGQWFAKGPMPTTPGESFTMTFKHSDMSPHKAPPPEKMRETDANGHISNNRLLKYEPPHLLVFTFGPETRPGEVSEVEFKLSQEGDPKDNLIRFTLTHRKIPDRAFALAVSGGWHSHLAVLQYRAEGKVPPAFWDIWRKYDGVYESRYD